MLEAKLDRRQMLQTTAVAMSASLFVDSLMQPAHAASDKLFRVRTGTVIHTTDPGYMVGGFEMVLQFACLPRLTSYINGDKWGWKPSDFVKSVQRTNDKTITFELMPGFKWYDGTSHKEIGELSAEDVKYSLERIKKSQWKDKAAALDHVEVTGSHTGIIHLSEPFTPIFNTWLCDGTGTIVCKKAVEAAGGKFEGMFGFYCGPYRVKEWTEKQHYTLEANPNWSGPTPHIKNIEFIIIGKDKAAEIAFEAGDVDITFTSVDAIPRLQKSPPQGSNMTVDSSTEWCWMGMNTDNPSLKDIRVRRAVQYAVNVPEVIAGAWSDVPVRARGVVPPGLIGYRKTTRFEKPDPAKARELLKEAGVKNLHLTLKTLNLTDRMAAAQIIQSNLADVGITVEVVPLDSGPFWNLGLESAGDAWKTLQLWIMQYGDSPDPSQMLQWYVSSQVGIWNWERWKDPEFDKLFHEGLVETDPAKRNKIYLRMQQIMEDTGAYVWLMFPPMGVLYRSDLEPSIRPNGELWYMSDFKWKGTST